VGKQGAGALANLAEKLCFLPGKLARGATDTERI
jgi:hypothetical protein